MPFYLGFSQLIDKKHVANRLLALREQIRSEIPSRTIKDTLLLATWNIRDFDSNKFGHGPRLQESFYYIAEIISSFDIIALQEVNDDLSALKIVMNFLGTHYDYIVTDVTAGRSGNSERMAFVFDSRKVRFQNVAGEIVLPESEQIQTRETELVFKKSWEIELSSDQLFIMPNGDSVILPRGHRISLPAGQKLALPPDHKIAASKQFARTPFLVSFKAGWFQFNLCTVHIYYGDDRGEKYERRISEIAGIARFLAKRAKKNDENYIMLGDFNILTPNDRTMSALKHHHFFIPPQLENLPTNLFGNRHYDQIAFLLRENELQLGDSPQNAGALDFYKSVFRAKDFEYYYEKASRSYRKNIWDIESKGSYKGDIRSYQQKFEHYLKVWRTFQMSDHLPMWIELKINFSDQFLARYVN